MCVELCLSFGELYVGLGRWWIVESGGVRGEGLDGMDVMFY